MCMVVDRGNGAGVEELNFWWARLREKHTLKENSVLMKTWNTEFIRWLGIG